MLGYLQIALVSAGFLSHRRWCFRTGWNFISPIPL
jgi:hypothetical protein